VREYYYSPALTYDVATNWMTTTGDNCSFTTTNAVNGWGTAQTYYDTAFEGLGKTNRLGPALNYQRVFTVKYPFLGSYRVAVSPYDDTFEIKPAVSPVRTQAVIGTQVTFSTRALGAGLSYRWQTRAETESSWTDVPSATSASLQVTAQKSSMFCREYRAIISSPAGEFATSAGVVVDQLPPPAVTQDLPESITVKAGSAATLNFVASSSFYRWYVNGSMVTSGWGTYTTEPLTLANDGMQIYSEAVAYAGNHQCTAHGVAKSKTTTVRVVP
jgi:hypothetical protein